MAYRIEVLDDFRLGSLAREIYTDLVRYGMFLRDNRGKSVRGAFVPRLYLRRLLLPFGKLALSKRDSVKLTCSDFEYLLIHPDEFRAEKVGQVRAPKGGASSEQTGLPFVEPEGNVPPEYDDLDDALEQDSDEASGEGNSS